MNGTKRLTRKKKTKTAQSLCETPIQVPVSKSSFEGVGEDFYTWVNESWEKSVKLPGFENDFSVSEEVERCIHDKSLEIITSPNAPEYLKHLTTSCYNEKFQDKSIEFLQTILQSTQAIETKDQVYQHFANMCKIGFTSIFKFQFHNADHKKISLFVDVDAPGLSEHFYKDENITHHYKTLLHNIGEKLEIPNIPETYELEKNIMFASNKLFNDTTSKIKGHVLERKFSKIPWKIFFDTLQIRDWRKMTMYYTSPKWIRYIASAIQQTPIAYWRAYLAKCYIIESLQFLPEKYSKLHFEFFGKVVQGQKISLPKEELLVKIVYNSDRDNFSKLFWDTYTNDELAKDIYDFARNLVESAKHRIRHTEWMKDKTRTAAIQKVSAMSVQTVKPDLWPPFQATVLEPDNLLKNIIILGERNTQFVMSQIGDDYKYWEEGIFRVNAYYFNEINEMIIPYGTCVEPFYIHGRDAWNYGGLGAIIGHEMCHGFDEEGKEFNEHGQKKRWWTNSDNRGFNHKTKELVALFKKQIVEGRHVDGDKTLSENIADLGGLAISLQALQDSMKRRGVEDVKKEYREFFISFATSWRTKYRPKKLKSSLGVDPHAPAFLRVNLIVSQFEEWYSAFDVKKSDKLYIVPEKRIRIF